MSDTSQPEDIRKYLVTYGLDRGDFFRRECPSCARQYKTKTDPEDLTHMLQPSFRQVGSELGGFEQEEQQAPQKLYCPYCGQYTKTDTTFTFPFVRYLHRYMQREFVIPLLRKFSSDLEDTFGRQRPRSKGLVSISFEFKAGEITLPPRPISGPEPPDMIRVHLLCCNKYIKILDSWTHSIVCPYCGANTVLH